MLEFALTNAPKAWEDHEAFNGCISVIGDLANIAAVSTEPTFVAGAKQVLNTQAVATVLEQAQKHESEDVQATANWAMDEIKYVISRA